MVAIRYVKSKSGKLYSYPDPSPTTVSCSFCLNFKRKKRKVEVNGKKITLSDIGRCQKRIVTHTIHEAVKRDCAGFKPK